MPPKRAAKWIVYSSLAAAGLAQENAGFDAARRGDLASLKVFVQNKANTNLRDAAGRTALHEAAANCQLEASKLLVASGWDILARDAKGLIPIQLANTCKDGYGDFMLLLGFPGKSSASESAPWSLQYAAAHKQPAVIALLLNAGVDVNNLGSEGNRALDIACLKGDAESVRILLERGANPNLRNPTGGTPLHDAAAGGNKDVIQLLLSHGADLNARDTESQSTPLHHAASFGRIDAVKILLERGADQSLKNAQGLTALQLAARNNHDDVSAVLRLAEGAK